MTNFLRQANCKRFKRDVALSANRQEYRGVEKTSGDAEKFLKIRLRELRKKAGLTQEQYAEAAKFSYKYYQGIERGQWTNLRLRTLEKLARGYGIAIHELFAPRSPSPRVRMKAKRRSD
jgi:DNA-binding XRE family transcriptional regulator